MATRVRSWTCFGAANGLRPECGDLQVSVVFSRDAKVGLLPVMCHAPTVFGYLHALSTNQGRHGSNR